MPPPLGPLLLEYLQCNQLQFTTQSRQTRNNNFRESFFLVFDGAIFIETERIVNCDYIYHFSCVCMLLLLWNPSTCIQFILSCRFICPLHFRLFWLFYISLCCILLDGTWPILTSNYEIQGSIDVYTLMLIKMTQSEMKMKNTQKIQRK